MNFLIAGLVLLLSVGVNNCCKQQPPPPEKKLGLTVKCAQDYEIIRVHKGSDSDSDDRRHKRDGRRHKVSYNERSSDIHISLHIHISLQLLQLEFSCESKALNLRATDLKLNFFIQKTKRLLYYAVRLLDYSKTEAKFANCTCGKDGKCTTYKTLKYVNQFTLPSHALEKIWVCRTILHAMLLS